ncbi:MAG: cupin domain-containing protein [Woeseiaceae bacterium]|nr:cupin domain-containing protein [Woeseiaceae bacterium]
MKRPDTRVLLAALVLTLVSAPIFSSETAIVVDPDDPNLAWGPCPDFMPAGCEIAVLHGDPAKPNVDILFRVPGGSVIPPHGHTSAERMILLSGELEVTYEGQDTVTLNAGQYAYGPAGLLHDAYCAQGDDCVLFIAFEEPLDAYPVDSE